MRDQDREPLTAEELAEYDRQAEARYDAMTGKNLNRAQRRARAKNHTEGRP